MELPPGMTGRIAHGLRMGLRRAEALDERALGAIGLAPREYGLLALLEEGPLARQHEVGAALGMDRSTTATLVRSLVDRGLVHRAPQAGNGRVLVLALTPAGDALRATGARRLAFGERELLAPLSSGEREQLRGLLSRLQGLPPRPRGATR